MSPALIFDCDGVLADTERYGHLPAFNETFAEVGLPVRWSDADYARYVQIGGGKERMASLLTPELVAAAGLPTDPGEQAAMVADWHRRKTARYTAKVAAGAMPARPGIARIVEEAADAGWTLAVASTSAEPAVRAVLEHVVGADRARDFAVFAGDVVAHKKPAPDIYLLTLGGIGARAADVVVVEDSANGLRAARAAGLTTVVTVSTYTVAEDFTGAALVVSSLGDPDEKAQVIDDPHRLGIGPEVTLADLARLLHLDRPRPAPPTRPTPSAVPTPPRSHPHAR
ncbi:HAD-IA family hydrolase [Pengzhenrongella sicca]|uniref:HAD-IA family hydrolase n=1 Tax=Pengzhenrongella sicca TaxID=2819238 RepID=A0A8A4ZG97_9MICO|nr:HAD-IA family hydrolase [Pengzhenrongella sicca]QTE30924.1 HAD-IA family hydrolase [Pengzhenrongella sicca]